jgi:recombination associated protein RdgC
MMYRLVSPWQVDAMALEGALQEARFMECGASQEKAVGWIEPRGVDHGPLLEIVAGQWMMKLMLEVKVIPGSVVKRKADEQLQHIEATTGRKPGRKEARDIREDARLSLLPMAFTKQSTTLVWVDPKAGLLVLDAASQAKADEVLTCLVKAVTGLAVQLIDTRMSPAAAMAMWLSTKEAPSGFSVDRECELKAADESKAVVRYTRHALDTDDVAQHIALGKMPTRLALTWKDHVSFVLTEALQLKKVAILDVVLEAAASLASDGRDDNFDADVTIATAELSQLIPDLLEVLGGEGALVAAST